mmetsp:Transcript_87932/g.273298  ORF Transcript_87932/g.273298 Transcript_87932/m.273298 type:complete len:113 (+) Transcript_87932:57-395(+)
MQARKHARMHACIYMSKELNLATSEIGVEKWEYLSPSTDISNLLPFKSAERGHDLAGSKYCHRAGSRMEQEWKPNLSFSLAASNSRAGAELEEDKSDLTSVLLWAKGCWVSK